MTQPLEEDWEFADCPLAGLPGHHFCGMCKAHNQPMLACGPECWELSRDANFALWLRTFDGATKH